MSVYITGTKSQKLVAGQSVEVTPFVGTNGEDGTALFGVGFYLNDGMNRVFGRPGARSLLQAYRTMKFVEWVPNIVASTLDLLRKSEGIGRGWALGG